MHYAHVEEGASSLLYYQYVNIITCTCTQQSLPSPSEMEWIHARRILTEEKNVTKISDNILNILIIIIFKDLLRFECEFGEVRPHRTYLTYIYMHSI